MLVSTIWSREQGLDGKKKSWRISIRIYYLHRTKCKINLSAKASYLVQDLVNKFLFQSTNKCLHFVASGNTHVILGEAVRVKEKKLKVEEKKRKRKKSKKDQSSLQSSLIQSPTESSVGSGLPGFQSSVQSSVQASPNSNSSNEIDNRHNGQTSSKHFQNDPVSMRSEGQNSKNSNYSNEKEWSEFFNGRRISKLSVILSYSQTRSRNYSRVSSNRLTSRPQ